MADTHLTPSPLRASRSSGLSGRLRPPGDKSVSHRALIFGLLCVGETTIEGLLEGEDVLRTGAACRQLGARVTRHGEGALERAMAPGSARSCRHRRRSTSATPAPALG